MSRAGTTWAQAGRRIGRIAGLSAAIAASAGALEAADDPTYVALRAAGPDGRSLAVANLVFDRDAYGITLNGTLHLLGPVAGRTFGAVFLGKGSYVLTPATEAERCQLAVYTDDPKLSALSDEFDQAVFFDTALLEQAERAFGPSGSGKPTSEAEAAWDEYSRAQRKDLRRNIQVRLLDRLLPRDPAPQPLFLAWIKSKKHRPALLAVDPHGLDALGLTHLRMGSEKTLMLALDTQRGGIWYSSQLRNELETGQVAKHAPPAHPLHYEIETTIAANGGLSGTTTITFETRSPDLRVLPLRLRDTLRIRDAQFAREEETPSWTAVPFVQEKEEEDADPAVIFPAALRGNTRYLLKVAYHGGKEVLTDAGDGNYTVGSRESWYPNINGFDDLATYDLTFHTPPKNQIVAVGNLVSDTTSGATRTTVWKSEHPLRVAGFNYGRFKKLSETDKDSGLVIDVYTNPGTPDVINEMNQYLGTVPKVLSEADSSSVQTLQRSGVQVDTPKLAQWALADAINTGRLARHFFGPLPHNRVSITQQSQWSFGQSWPTLIYLPYIAFLDSTVRHRLGLTGAADFVDLVGPHELAHQWWGHNVYGESYRDEWLSEGFAEFTAGLLLHHTGGQKVYNDFWEKKRRQIFERSHGAAIANHEAGPISQGVRLSNWRTPQAYMAIVYNKGAYVLHMLRMTMQDGSKKNPDEAFIAMMTDFSQAHAGKNASTADFQKVVERHLTPALRATRDGKLDWFFDQWVRGTAIPKYVAKLELQGVGGGKYRISGSVTQSEVPEGFMVAMPVYVELARGEMVRVAMVGLKGSSTTPVDFQIALPQKPVKVAINAMHDVLAR